MHGQSKPNVFPQIHWTCLLGMLWCWVSLCSVTACDPSTGYFGLTGKHGVREGRHYVLS